MTKRELVAIVAALLHSQRNGIAGYGEEDMIAWDVGVAEHVVEVVTQKTKKK